MQIFILSSADLKINQRPYVIFQATNQFSFNFCIAPSRSWHMIPLRHSSWNKCFWQKEPINVQIFKPLSTLMKVHKIYHASFETTRSEFIQILNHCSVSWEITPLYYLAQSSYTLDKNSLSKWNFQTFAWLGENSQNSLCHISNHISVFL